MTLPVVVAGASGFVGRALVERLEAVGREVRCGSRDPARRAGSGRTWVRLDVDTGAGLDEALGGADALFYLVHHLGARDAELAAMEERAAERVLRAAERAGLRRIVYLGGPVPAGPSSPHLLGRRRTGEILRGGAVSTIELRASMIVGAGSASWRLCRDLALRLPLMAVPSRLTSRTEPVGLDDVLVALVTALDLPLAGSAAFDLPGPEVLSPTDIMRRVAALAGYRPVLLAVPGVSPGRGSVLVRLVSHTDADLVRQLIEGMEVDLLSTSAAFWRHLPEYVRTPFDVAARRALDAEGEGSGLGRLWEAGVRRVAGRLRPVVLQGAME